MKAVVYGGPGRISLEQRPKPVLQSSGDAIVRMVKTTICGTDLHILKGDVATVGVGRILGHEGVGVIEATGPAVLNFKPGDRVLVSCISADGSWAIRLTGARPSMCEHRTRIRASIIFPGGSMKKRW
jgi:alcohol dehydrogenase